MQSVKDTNKTHELGSCITDMICAWVCYDEVNWKLTKQHD